jgi:hypothetical protein
MTTTANERQAYRSTGLRDVLRLRIELWIAVVCMALAFGAGMAVRVTASQSTAPPTSFTGIDPGTGVVAPPLTDQQIDQGLPAGHPDLSGGAASAKAGSANGSKADQGAKGDGAKDGDSANADAAGTP